MCHWQDRRAQDHLLKCLDSPNSELRFHAVSALRGICGEKSIDPLIRLITDAHEATRAGAAAALGSIPAIRALEPLIKALRDDFPSVRLAAAEALGKIGDKRSVQPLLSTFLKDDNYLVRVFSAVAMTKIREPLLKPILIKLQVESYHVNDITIRSREVKYYSFALEPLSKAFKNGDIPTRIAVTTAMVRIGGPRIIETLARALKDRNTDVRITAVRALGQIGTGEAIQLLRSALDDSSQKVRFRAIEKLAHLRDISAVEPLLGMLADKNQEDREAITLNLGFLGSGNKKAGRVIRKALAQVGDDMRKEADDVLRIMDEEEEHNSLYAELTEEVPCWI